MNVALRLNRARITTIAGVVREICERRHADRSVGRCEAEDRFLTLFKWHFTLFKGVWTPPEGILDPSSVSAVGVLIPYSAEVRTPL